MVMEWLLAAIVTGSFVFCVLVVVAAWHYLAKRKPLPHGRGSETATEPRGLEPVSILKPLSGAEEDLEENLRSFFRQDYPVFEILFAVREATDPAAAIVERLSREYPRVPSRLILTGEPPYPNAKVWSLHEMMAQARHDLLAMSDSDVRVTPGFLAVVAAEFQDSGLGLTTCPYRAVPGKGLWSTLEAIGMNTEFLSGILVARLLEGMKFAVGPTIVARRSVLEAIGGLDRVKEYLAEDFVLGQFASEAGFGVGLSSYVIEHRIGSSDFAENVRHRLRWCRSTRRSRPAGYAGQVFTNPVPLVLLLLLCSPAWWPLCGLAMAGRAAAAWATSGWVLRDPLCKRFWWLVAAEDLASFAFWVAGFFGNTIAWRGRRYYLRRDGRFERIVT